MKIRLFFVPFLLVVFLQAADQSKIPAMPTAVTSNSVTSLKNGLEVYSIMGIGTKRTWQEVSNKMVMLSLKSGKWSQAPPPVPGVAGRLASSAIGARGQIFVFGGYTVDGQGNELIVSDVNSYLPEAHRWYRAEDLPVAVEGAVIGVVHDRFIYIIGGRSRSGPVSHVQVYDSERNIWSQATPMPGTPVFGHAGGIADETIVYVDGAKKDPASGQYVNSDECWMGKIDRKDPNAITWSKLPAHPGPGRFGIVAGGSDHEHRIVFSGGTVAPHNLKGLADDGTAPDLSPVTFSFELHGNRWETITEDTSDVRADERGIAFTPLGPLIVGGTLKNSAVSGRVLVLPKK
ncbi:MAG TPA: kelch repeat-containing protein [Candidatus Sulfotelmatobacter sp.]|nr:kelch repeat-containing protein [Candidatus Sulfotelmatobacter sp.]